MGFKRNWKFDTQILGQRVKEIRKLRGLAQSELGWRAGSYTHVKINHLENGDANSMDARFLCDVADALNVSVDYLVGRSDVAGSPKEEEELA